MHALIVDDHSFTRVGIRRILQERYPEASFEECGSFTEAVASLSDTPRRPPQGGTLSGGSRLSLAVIDLSLPDGSGLNLIKEIKARLPDLPVLVVSMHSQLHYARRAMQLGANGYLSKDRAPEELALAAERALSGKLYIPEDMAGELFQQVLHGKDPVDLLSDREFEVFRALVAGQTVTELAQQLALSVKTVSTYRSRLMEKLNLETQADLVAYGRANLADSPSPPPS